MLRKLPLIAAVGALAVAIPATALSATTSGTCTTHKVAYVATGTFAGSSATLTGSTWSGTLTIKLGSANHHFTKANNLTIKKSAKGTDYTFAITGAKVKFGTGVKSPATTHDHITVKGTVTEHSGACAKTALPTIAITTITVSK